jgi:phospholipid/cholesterol/gamma-HCH transport system ATP-binding protein
MRDDGAFIQCRSLFKSFGAKPVLCGVDLAIARGETMVVLGASGSGKTVLLKHMNGLMSPDAGEIRVEGIEIGRMPEDRLLEIRKSVGMVFQGSALFDSLTVAENVAYPLKEHSSLSQQEIDDKVKEILSWVDLHGSLHLYPSQVSGGMKKRAALARALALNPKALLYDEPTTGLDPMMTQRINRLILDLQIKLGVTSVVVTHDLQSAFAVADRLAFLHEGRIRFVGTADELKAAADLNVTEFFDDAG